MTETATGKRAAKSTGQRVQKAVASGAAAVRKVTTPRPATKSQNARKPGRKSASGTEKTLTRERIVAVAIELIDLYGLNAFSLREVARQLDVYPTAVYWYVPNRDALLAAVVEETMRLVVPPFGKTDQSWQHWLKELFVRYRDAIRRHPNVAQLVGAQLVSNASLSPALIDRILTVLVAAGCKEAQLLALYNVVVAAMVGFVTLEFAPLPTDDLPGWRKQLQDQVHDIRALEYPTLARYLPILANRAFIVRWESGTEVPLDSSFDTFVDVTIDGIAQQIRAAP